jgi:hypothetical protein
LPSEAAWARAAPPKPELPLEPFMAAMSPRRPELMRHLRRAGPMSVRRLALGLARDDKSVHREVALLTATGLVQRRAKDEVAVKWDRAVTELDLAAWRRPSGGRLQRFEPFRADCLDRAAEGLHAGAEPHQLFLADAVMLRATGLDVSRLEFLEHGALALRLSRPDVDSGRSARSGCSGS